MSCKECEQRREWIKENVLKPTAETVRKIPAWVEQAFRVKAEADPPSDS